MKVQVGTPKYFENNRKELSSIKKISKESWLKDTVGGLMKFFRKIIVGKDFYEEKYNSYLKKVKSSINNNYYDEKINDYVKNILDELQNDAYAKFKSDIPKGLTDLLVNLDNYEDDLKNHPQLLSILNNYNGAKKLDSCHALEQLPKCLRDINTDDPNTEFLKLVRELKMQFASESVTKYLDVNFKEIKAALIWNWEKGDISTNPIKNFLSRDQTKRFESIEEIRIFAKEMKTQQIELIQTLPKENEFKIRYYGYLIDRIHEVKRVSQLRVSEVNKRKKVENAFANYMASQIEKDLNDSKKLIQDLKGYVENSSQGIKQCRKDINEIKNKMGWGVDKNSEKYIQRQESLRILKESKNVRKETHKLYVNEWNECFENFKNQIKQSTETLENLSSKSKPSRIDKLLNEKKESQLLLKNIESMESVFLAKVEWDLIGYNWKTVNFKIEDSTSIDQFKDIINKCSIFKAKIVSLKNDFDKIPENARGEIYFKNFSEDKEKQPINYVMAKGYLNTLFEELNGIASEASNLLELKSAKLITITPKTSQTDQATLASLSQYELEIPKNYSVYSTIFMSLDKLENSDLKDESTLRHRLSQYIFQNSEIYKPLVFELIQNDILSYIEKGPAELTPIMQAIPSLNFLYQRYRSKFKIADEEEQAEIVQNIQKIDSDEIFKKYCDAYEKVPGSTVELIGIKNMLNLNFTFYGSKISELSPDLSTSNILGIPIFFTEAGHFLPLKQKTITT